MSGSGAGSAVRESAGAYGGTPAALPIAAAGALLLSRFLPIRFHYRENEFGIVSPSTLQQYPVQQETFWLFFGLVAGSLLAWGLGRLLRCERPPVASVIALEALGVSALVAVLALPVALGAVVFALATASAVWLASRAPLAPLAGVREPVISKERTALWLFAVAVVVLLLLPDVWVNYWRVHRDLEDGRFVNDSFEFQAEWGQHLAWGQAIVQGGFPGRDFFTLYGPLYDLGLVAFWELVSHSIVGWLAYVSTTRLFAWIGFVVLARVLLRSWKWTLLVPFLMSGVELRIGLALLALAFAVLWLQSGRRVWCAASGAVTGVSLLYSQEFGLAVALTALLAFALRRDARAGLVYAAGLSLLMLPFLGWLQANDALLPMLRDLVEYPRYMMAGYAKHPFPALASEIPLPLAELRSYESLVIRYGYALPAIGAGALLLTLPVSAIEPRRPLASLRRALDELARDPDRLALLLTAVFGLIAFRSALGRSSLARSVACAAPMALLLAVAIERGVAHWRCGGGVARLASWRIGVLLALAFASGLAQQAHPITLVARTVDRVWTLATVGHRPQGQARTLRVARWVQLNTEPGEAVLFLPNNAAYYYLTRRPSPIRFVLGSQIVTEEHRREVLADLRAAPPRFIVWDPQALRADDLPDTLVFGEELMRWMEESYVVDTLLGTIEVWKLRQDDATGVVDSES